MQCFDDAITFPPFALFSKIFRFPSNDLQKDSYIKRYAQHENFYPALCFYPKTLCEVMLTLLHQSYFVTLRKCLSKYSNSLVIDVQKKTKNKYGML